MLQPWTRRILHLELTKIDIDDKRHYDYFYKRLYVTDNYSNSVFVISRLLRVVYPIHLVTIDKT